MPLFKSPFFQFFIKKGKYLPEKKVFKKTLELLLNVKYIFAAVFKKKCSPECKCECTAKKIANL